LSEQIRGKESPKDMRKYACLGILSALLIGCSQSSDSIAELAKASPISDPPQMVSERKSDAMGSAPEASATLANSPSAPTPNPIIENRAVIRTGSLTVRVKSVEKAERATAQLVGQVGGYVEGSQSGDLAGENPSITMSLRIPVRQFESVIERCEALGVRLAKTINSQDVTGQLVDLDARVKVLRAEEGSYVTMLASARNLNNIIELRSHLTELRSTIESIAGQRKALGDQATLSSLNVTLQQESIPLATTQKDDNWLALTWTDATNRLFVFGKGVVTLGIYALLFAPFAILVGWGIWRLARRPEVARI
jgi:Domain of unknown function (DUF4349)